MLAHLSKRSHERIFHDVKYWFTREFSGDDPYVSTLNSRVIKLIKRKNKKQLTVIKEPACFNCGHPFFGSEKYCPDCGQKNKSKKITFASFVKEVFNGFVSLDAKFWQTIIPLLTKPGKVSHDFINGKRARYSNPFQFYITVSIFFFIVIGLLGKYDEFKELTDGKAQKASQLNMVKFSPDTNTKELDSLRQVGVKQVENVLKNTNMDSTAIKEISKEMNKMKLDSLRKQSNMEVDLGDATTKIKKMANFQKENPKLGIDKALDSLKYEKNFGNRFVYRKAGVINSFRTDPEQAFNDFGQELISYASISIFIFLPIFTLFLKMLYIRRSYTYVEHLIFIFHTQTVFFILLTIFVLLEFAFVSEHIGAIFTVLFLIYLLIAMKRFYQQGIIKTFIKFIILNQIYMLLATIGLAIVSVIAFAFY